MALMAATCRTAELPDGEIRTLDALEEQVRSPAETASIPSPRESAMDPMAATCKTAVSQDGETKTQDALAELERNLEETV